MVYNDSVGSWEGDIRIWKLDSKLKNFSFIGAIPAPGVINSLQLISPPKEFFQSSRWIMTQRPSDNQGQAAQSRKGSAPSVLLIAAVGKEHRLGRWLTVRDGVANGTIVIALSPRTSA